jgi:hypothetical protein
VLAPDGTIVNELPLHILPLFTAIVGEGFTVGVNADEFVHVEGILTVKLTTEELFTIIEFVVAPEDQRIVKRRTRSC